MKTLPLLLLASCAFGAEPTIIPMKTLDFKTGTGHPVRLDEITVGLGAIVRSPYEPTVTKHADGSWLISFGEKHTAAAVEAREKARKDEAIMAEARALAESVLKPYDRLAAAPRPAPLTTEWKGRLVLTTAANLVGHDFLTDRDTEIGLRSDGVLVWRRAVK